MAKQVDPAAVEGAVPDSAEARGPVLAAEASPASYSQASASPAGATATGGAVSTGGLTPSQLGPYPSFHGRTVSWVAVSIIMAGFLIGGLALVFGHHGPTWWLFWTGIGVSVVGLLTTLATNTFEDWY